ncbi:MAG: mandelate racemase/muconate lactonizing enzyme family protein, partial [Promethearchaeota archaeon]
TPIYVPFTEQVRQLMGGGEGGLGMAIGADEPWLGVDAAICKISTDDGSVGIGEVITWLPETGVSIPQTIDTIENYLGSYLIGKSPFEVERIRQILDVNVARNEVAKGLLDMCLYDLMGKITRRSAIDFMGGRTVDQIPLSALIPLAEPETMLMLAQMFYKEGYRTFRYKLGKNIQNDLEITKLLREKLGPDVRLRVDYNQAYSAAEAVRAIKAIEPYGIDFAEQPVDKNNFLAMAYVQKRVETPLMAHEGFFSINDFTTLVEMEAVGVVGINTERPGGVTNALKAIDYAKLRGLGVVLHSQPLGISSAIHIHLASARFHSIDYATELFGQVMIEDDLIVNPLNYHNGMVDVPTGTGWGVELDESALEKYAKTPTFTIKK